MCCLALSAGFVGPRFTLLLVDLRRQGRRSVLDLPLAAARAARPAVDDDRLRPRLGPAQRRLGRGVAARRARRVRGSRDVLGESAQTRYASAPDVARKPCEHDGVESRAVAFPVRAQHPLAAEAGALREPECGDVLGRDDTPAPARARAPRRPSRSAAAGPSSQSRVHALPGRRSSRPRRPGAHSAPASPRRGRHRSTRSAITR